MIFYFTGTGNCLHVARELAVATENENAAPTKTLRWSRCRSGKPCTLC